MTSCKKKRFSSFKYYSDQFRLSIFSWDQFLSVKVIYTHCKHQIRDQKFRPAQPYSLSTNFQTVKWHSLTLYFGCFGLSYIKFRTHQNKNLNKTMVVLRGWKYSLFIATIVGGIIALNYVEWSVRHNFYFISGITATCYPIIIAPMIDPEYYRELNCEFLSLEG